MNSINTKWANSRFKKVTADFTYNILAAFIATGVMQVIVYPQLAIFLGASEYGTLLTAMGIVNTISMSLGGTLNNTRLIQHDKYYQQDKSGDYNILLVFANLIGFIVMCIAGIIFFQLNAITIGLLACTIVLSITKSYLCVSYRLKLDYKTNLLLNVISGVGLIIGIISVKITHIWPLAFIAAEAFSVVFLLFTTDLHKEPFRKTKLFRKTTLKYSVLIVTGIMSSLLLYLDRLIVYPFLGGEAVSTYTVASFFGKSLGLLMTPVAGVLLSYYAQKNFVMTIRKFRILSSVILFSAIIFFGISLLFSPWLTGLLYPTLIAAAYPYLIMANGAAIIGVMGLILDPVVLKYAPIYWQIILYVIYSCSYIGLAVVMINRYNLIGLCIAVICANSIKLCFLFFLGGHFLKKGNLNERIGDESKKT